MLASHPRLYLPGTRTAPTGPVGEQILAQILADATRWLDLTGVDHVPAMHNGHLERARHLHQRVVTVLAAWVQTGEQRFRDAAVAHIEALARWEYWSWITWRQADSRPEAIFDLSYGKNSVTLATAYDLLYDELTDQERTFMVELARDRALQPFLQVVDRGEAWWLGKDDSNWNTVCTAGAGMLALAMAEELDESARVLAIVEDSFTPFFTALERTDGGWPEGIGYWSFGMIYAFRYLRSHERATGRPHRLLRAEATGKTIDFPLDFFVYGNPCSFGDANAFDLSAIHVHVAEQLGREQALQMMTPLLAAGAMTAPSRRPHAGEALLLGVDVDRAAAAEVTTQVGGADPVRTYEGLGWVRMADRWPDPALCLTIRGGRSGVPHGHRDLLSFHAVVGREKLIENITPHEYLDTTFGPRREELFEMGPASKNVPLIDGVGIGNGQVVIPESFVAQGFPGIRLDATAAFGVARNEDQLAEEAVRTFLHLGRGVLVIDRIRLAQGGRVETRLHSCAEVTADGARAVIRGDQERLTVVHAARTDAEGEFGLTVAPTVPTTPGDDATLIRWCGPKALGRDHLIATLMVPGDADAEVSVDQEGVAVRIADWSARF